MENNKLIAEFMGLENVNTLTKPMYEYGESGGCRSLEDLWYHTSWDWLMPVIENIDHLQHEPVMPIEKALSTRSIDDTYRAVVEFIKEYNKN